MFQDGEGFETRLRRVQFAFYVNMNLVIKQMKTGMRRMEMTFFLNMQMTWFSVEEEV